jgi:hypothetical protein
VILFLTFETIIYYKLMWNKILIVLIIATFISTIFLIVQSGKNENQTGTYVGYILMSFILVFPIALYLVGKYFVEYFNGVFIFVFGTFVLFIAIILIVGLATNTNVDTVEKFINAQGICEKDGKMGYVINNVCDITNTINCEAAVEKSIKDTCPESSKSGTRSTTSTTRSTTSTTRSTETFAPVEKGPPVMGICSYENNGKTIFGFRHPDRGALCLSKEQMTAALKSNSKQVIPGISYSSNQIQSTSCFKYPKSDYISYDIECKKKFGVNYGLKEVVENIGCDKNDYQARCETGYQAGAKIPENSTKCVPIGKDMNVVCQANHVDNPGKFGKYLRVGYKTIDFTGCPKGSQRAICDGNYYDGKELFGRTTDPFPQTENPNRKCQAKFGLLSFAKQIISENCAVGYVRAECTKGGSA